MTLYDLPQGVCQPPYLRPTYGSSFARFYGIVLSDTRFSRCQKAEVNSQGATCVGFNDVLRRSTVVWARCCAHPPPPKAVHIQSPAQMPACCAVQPGCFGGLPVRRDRGALNSADRERILAWTLCRVKKKRNAKKVGLPFYRLDPAEESKKSIRTSLNLISPEGR